MVDPWRWKKGKVLGFGVEVGNAKIVKEIGVLYKKSKVWKYVGWLHLHEVR